MNTQQNTSRLRRSVVAAAALGTSALLVFAAPVAAIAHDNGENNAPFADDDFYTVVEGQTLSVPAPGFLANDGDLNGDAFTLQNFEAPLHGILGLNPNGSFTYTPTAGFLGQDSFMYWIQDEHGAIGDGATVTIQVDDDNVGGPVAVSDTYMVTPETTLTVPAATGVLVNDTLPVGGHTLLTTNPNFGQLSLDPTGAFVYTPDAGFVGPDEFWYQIDPTDPTIPLGNSVQVLITVGAPPPTGANDTFTVVVGSSLVLPAPGVLANDSSSNGHQIRAYQAGGAWHGTNGGVEQDGSINYQTSNNYIGTDVFVYRVQQLTPNGLVESTSGNITVTINIVPAGPLPDPIAVADSYTVEKDTLFSLAAPGVTANDSNLGAGVKTTPVVSPSHGLLALFSDGTMTYQPVAGYVGPDSFQYRLDRVVDGNIVASSAPVTVTLTVVDSTPEPVVVPIAANDSYTTPAGQVLQVPAAGVLLNDSLGGADSLVPDTFNPPTHGLVNLWADGSLTYTPDAGFVGPDSFTYAVHALVGGAQVATSELATVTIDVTESDEPVDLPDPQNLAPFAMDDVYQVTAGSMIMVPAPGVLDNDSDPEGDAIKFHLITDAAHGTFSYLSNGSFSYTPDAGFVGTDTVTYAAQEQAGDEKNSAPATISLEVLGGTQLDPTDPADPTDPTDPTTPTGQDLPTEAADSSTTAVKLAQTGTDGSSWIVLASFLLIYAGGMALRFTRKHPLADSDEA